MSQTLHITLILTELSKYSLKKGNLLVTRITWQPDCVRTDYHTEQIRIIFKLIIALKIVEIVGFGLKLLLI